MKKSGRGFDTTYYPNINASIYEKRYKKYQTIGKFMEQFNS